MVVSDEIDPHASKGFLLTQAADTERPMRKREVVSVAVVMMNGYMV